MPRLPADDPVWLEARRAWSEGEPLPAIARRLGVPRQTLSSRAKAGGWSPRPAPDKGARAEQRKDPSCPPHPTSPPASQAAADAPFPALRDGLIRRAYAVLDLRLEQMEQRLKSGEPLSPGESERLTKEIGTFAGALEKVTEVAADARAFEGERTPIVETLADVERVRRELAARLHLLWGDKEP